MADGSSIACPHCMALMQGPTLDASHTWLWWSCTSCPCNVRRAASEADVKALNNVIDLNARRAAGAR